VTRGQDAQFLKGSKVNILTSSKMLTLQDAHPLNIFPKLLLREVCVYRERCSSYGAFARAGDSQTSRSPSDKGGGGDGMAMSKQGQGARSCRGSRVGQVESVEGAAVDRARATIFRAQLREVQE
jgi:hypothetical protein